MILAPSRTIVEPCQRCGKFPPPPDLRVRSPRHAPYWPSRVAAVNGSVLTRGGKVITRNAAVVTVAEGAAADCTCCGPPGQGDDCACVIPVLSVTVTISGMSADGGIYNATYPSIPVLVSSGAICTYRYNWEEIEPTPSVEINFDFNVNDDGSVAMFIGSAISLGDYFQSGVSPPKMEADEFCLGDPIVFSTNENSDPAWAGTVTVTAD